MWDLIVSVPDHCLSLDLEISDIETRGIILSMQHITKTQIRLRGCTG